MRDVSIMISAKDNYSDALLKMQKTQTAFRKDLGQLGKELNQFNQTKITLKTDLTKAKKELTEAEKAFKATGSEVARLQMEAAQANYDNIKSNLDLVSKAARKTEHDMQNLTGTLSKTETRASGAGDTLSTLAKAGLFAQLGNAAADLGGAVITSAFGSRTGNAITSVLSGAATGAAIGSIVPGIGTAVGAAVGTVAGGIQALTQEFQNRDDAYRSSVQGLYEDVTSGRAEQLSTGSAIAGTREQRQISFATLIGSDAAASEYLSQMRAFAEKTPFGEDQLAAMSKTLLAYNYQVGELLPLLTAVGDAGSALSMSGDDMNWVAASLGKMNTTSKATMEYLNPLLERGIPVFDYLSNAFGKSNKQVQEMLSKGLIPGEKAAEIIAYYMGHDFAGNMEKQAGTYLGLVSTLEDMQASVDAAMGEGYNEVRKKDMEEQIAWYESEGGKRLKQTNQAIGAYEASLVGKQEELLRNAQDETWRRIDELGITDAETQGMMLAEAKAKAQVDYTQTTEYQSQYDAQMNLIDRIQQAVTPEYVEFGRAMAESFSQGFAANLNINASPNYLGETSVDDFLIDQSMAPGSAYGISYVPYNNFPRMLHEGERVLTAAKARQMDAAGSLPPINFTGPIIVREEADIHRVAVELCHELQRVQQGYVEG